MQLALIVLTGYIVAVSPLVSRLLEYIAGLASTDRGAIALMGLVSMGAAWLHWGLGLIAGPIFLHFLIRRHPKFLRPGRPKRVVEPLGFVGTKIAPELHEARESIWTPEQEQPAETPKLWTPGSKEQS